MASGTSLGGGIALRSGNRKDYVSKIADNYAKQQAARAKAKADANKEANKYLKESIGKFSVDPKEKYVPMYLEKIKEMSTGAINDLVQMKKSGASGLEIYIKATELQKDLSALYGYNREAYSIYENKDNNMVSPVFVDKLMAPKGKPEDLIAFKNPVLGINIDPETYAISYPKIPKKMEVPKLDPDQKGVIDATRAQQTIPGTNQVRVPFIDYVSNVAIEKEAGLWMKSDPIIPIQLLHEALYFNTPENELANYEMKPGESIVDWSARTGLDKKVEELSKVKLAQKAVFTEDNPIRYTGAATIPRPSGKGYGRSKAQKIAPTVEFIQTDNVYQSNLKGADKIGIRIENEAMKNRFESLNPQLNGKLKVGDVLQFIPDSGQYDPNKADMSITGEWDFADSEIDYYGRGGRKTKVAANTNGIVPFDYFESSFKDMLGGGKEGARLSNRWFAEIRGKSFNINDYDKNTQETIKLVQKKYGYKDVADAIAWIARERAKQGKLPKEKNKL